MSGNFDVFFNPSLEESNVELPLFKEYKINGIDGNNNIEPAEKNSNLIILEGKEALKVWIYRALKTELEKYYIHTPNYGNRLREHIGTVYNKEIKEAIIQQEIIDCLMVNPYITNVYDFSFSYSEENRVPHVFFSVDTIYGSLIKEGVELIGI